MSESDKPTRDRESPHLGARIAARAVIWKAKTRTAVILVLLGMTAYLLSVLIGLPINIWLSKLVGDPTKLSTASKVILGAIALDASKFLVLAIFGFFVNRLLAVRPSVAALGITISCYAFDAVLAWVLQDLRQTWMNWAALVGRIPLAAGTWWVVFNLIRGSKRETIRNRIDSFRPHSMENREDGIDGSPNS